eukprot:2848112-Pleurochrysis_carterae.AAC.3
MYSLIGADVRFGTQCVTLQVYVTAKFVDVISNANPDASAFRNTVQMASRPCAAQLAMCRSLSPYSCCEL